MKKTSSHSAKTLSIGGATYDLFVRTGRSNIQSSPDGAALHLPLGAKIHVDGVIETCGGGAANTSVGLRRLGCTSGFCGVVGSDQWGECLVQNFKNEGVDTTSLVLVEGEMTSFSLILSAGSGERVILYEAGTNSHMHDALFDKESASACDWIFLNHIHDRSCIIEDDLLEILTAKDGPGLSWNPGGCHIEKGMDERQTKELLQNTDLLFLNKEEALAFTRAKDEKAAMGSLLAAGVATVFITDGPRGAVGCDGKEWCHCPHLPDAPVVDTTGAGDAFATGVTWGHFQGFSLPEMLRAGTMNATSVLGFYGAERGLLTHTEITSRLASSPLSVDVSAFSL